MRRRRLKLRTAKRQVPLQTVPLLKLRSPHPKGIHRAEMEPGRPVSRTRKK
jgi:hypothetical protein